MINLKILIIHHFGGIGGGFKSCVDVAKMFKNSGHDVTIGLPELDDSAKSLLKKNAIKFRIDIPNIIEFNYHNASSSSFNTVVKYIISLKNKNKWKEFFLSQDYDIVVLNSLIQVPLIKYIKASKKKTILFIRETIKNNRNTLFNRILLSKLSKADAVVFLTKYDQETWKIKKGPIQVVIPDIVDISSFSVSHMKIKYKKSNLRVKENTTCFLYLGGLCFVKGALDLLLAFNQYLKAGNEGHLFILGSDFKFFSNLGYLKKFVHKKDIKYTEECLSIIKKINRNECNITFVGVTQTPEEWYSISDIVIFPVKKVHQARPVYEAGYFKKPVILPKYPHFKEAVIENYNGLFYQPGNIEDLSQKMMELSKNSEKRNKLGKNNMEMYKQIHTFQNAEFILRELLQKLYA